VTKSSSYVCVLFLLTVCVLGLGMFLGSQWLQGTTIDCSGGSPQPCDVNETHAGQCGYAAYSLICKQEDTGTAIGPCSCAGCPTRWYCYNQNVCYRFYCGEGEETDKCKKDPTATVALTLSVTCGPTHNDCVEGATVPGSEVQGQGLETVPCL
jgi:hypothetical protein